MTVGVMLMAYGSPRTLDEVRPYLQDIRGGRPPSDEGVQELTERYRRIGGSSPLVDITQRTARALEARLGPDRYRVRAGMKHWHPYIAESAADLEDCDRVIGLGLAPHFSHMSIGGYESRLRDALQGGPDVSVVRSWWREPAFVEFTSAALRDALADWEPSGTRVFFTAHSLPERILEQGDPYRDQLSESSRLVAEAAGVDGWEFAFQSASHTGVPWLGPDILDRLDAFAAEGGRRAVVVPIGFVSEHLEILFDVDVECVEKAQAIGLELRRTALPNDDPRFVEVLASVVERAESGDLGAGMPEDRAGVPA
ncbi:MAG TPA: ferrochelatase [Actinomycetota bacterium]|nr:ferrochelatase [Actinomycetota bacterium]